MKRRVFLRASAGAGIGLLSGCVAQSHQPQRASTLIGYLGTAAVADPANVRAVEEFRQGLREQGLFEGKTVSIAERWSDGRGHTWAREQTAELVALGAQVLVANGSLWLPAREVADSVPIVMTGGDVERLITRGWAATAARPDGTITGLSFVPRQAFRKRLETLMAIVPRVRRLAIMSNLESDQESESERRTAAEEIGLEAVVFDVRTVAQLEGAFDEARRWGADAIAGEGLIPTKALAAPLSVLALKSGLPTTFNNIPGVEAGVLLYYGAVFLEGYQFRRPAWHVARIIAGTRPGDLPIEVPDQVRFAVNRRTLAALGLVLPPHIAMQVTDWID
jgi:putative tryptophan/tyrosine transport system substrate-binding protein